MIYHHMRRMTLNDALDKGFRAKRHNSWQSVGFGDIHNFGHSLD